MRVLAPTYPYEPGRVRATMFVIGAFSSTPAEINLSVLGRAGGPHPGTVRRQSKVPHQLSEIKAGLTG